MYFDTHAHYYDPAFDPDRTALLSRLPQEGVEGVICPGCDLPSSQAAIDLSRRFPFLYAAVGLHPENLAGYTPAHLSEVERLAGHRRVKAIGEIGLDYYWEKDEAGRRTQREFFNAQLDLAEKLDLPAIVHDREAHRDCLEAVKAHPGARGVFHCYSGSVEEAKTLVILGWMISFTGVITFKNARRALEVLEWLPMDRLMLETDAPYMAPEPFRGSRNHSGNLCYIAQAVSRVKGIPAEEVGRITAENARRFFALDEGDRP